VELRRRGDIEGDAMEHWCRGEIEREVVSLGVEVKLEVKRWSIFVG
jgi:hypothetical protein